MPVLPKSGRSPAGRGRLIFAMKRHTQEVWRRAMVARNPAYRLSGFGIVFASDVHSASRLQPAPESSSLPRGLDGGFAGSQNATLGCHWPRSFSFKQHQEGPEILCGSYIKEAIPSGKLSAVNAIPRKFEQRFRVCDTSRANPGPISSCPVKRNDGTDWQRRSDESPVGSRVQSHTPGLSVKGPRHRRIKMVRDRRPASPRGF